MRREHLEHLIRACADLTGDDHIVVIGSQAIHGSTVDPPAALLASLEADVYPRDRPERADVIDGAIGEDLPVEGSTRDAIAGRLGALGL